MADRTDYAPDFPDAPRPQRAVPKNVERAAAGALKKNIGAGRAWSAFETGATKQAHMAAYAQVGAEAAQNIRQRFYKKEWDQVKKLKVDPLLAKLSQAKAAYEQRTQRSIMPVQRIVTPEEGEKRRMLSLQAMENKVPGGEGQKDKTEVQLVPGENLAEQPGQYGAVAVEDQMAIQDPVTGQPVPFHGDPGQAIQRKAVDDFWGAYGAISTQIMDVMSEYQGNPFADYAAGTMIEQVMQQAGQGVTGKKTPEEQLAAQQQREMFDMEMDKGRADLTKAARAEEEAIGQRAGEANAARELAQDPQFAGYFTDAAKKKWAEGKELTPKQEYEAIGAMKAAQKAAQADMVMAAQQGRTRLPGVILSNPSQWMSHLRINDDGYKNYYNDMNKEVVIDVYEEMRSDPKAFIASRPNIPPDVMRNINADNFTDPGVVDWLQTSAATEEQQANFNATATALRMSDLAVQDPRVQDEIDRRVAATREQWINETGSVPENVDMMLSTYPEAFFVGAVTGADAGLRKPPGWEGAVQRYKASKMARSRGLGLPREIPTEYAPAPIGERTYTEDQIQSMGEAMQPRIVKTGPQVESLRDLVGLTPEKLGEVSQDTLGEALNQVKRILMVPGNLANMSEADVRTLRKLQRDLSKAHVGPVESFLTGQISTIGGGLKDFFTTSDEEKQRAEQKRQSLWLME